jgi:hypothetical protein
MNSSAFSDLVSTQVPPESSLTPIENEEPLKALPSPSSKSPSSRNSPMTKSKTPASPSHKSESVKAWKYRIMSKYNMTDPAVFDNLLENVWVMPTKRKSSTDVHYVYKKAYIEDLLEKVTSGNYKLDLEVKH